MRNALLLTMQCLIRAEGCAGSIGADERSAVLQDALNLAYSDDVPKR